MDRGKDVVAARMMIDFREQSAHRVGKSGGNTWPVGISVYANWSYFTRRVGAYEQPPAAFMRAAFEQWKWLYWNIVMVVRDASTRCPLFSRVAGSTMLACLTGSIGPTTLYLRYPGYHDGRVVAWWRCLESGGINSIMDTKCKLCLTERHRLAREVSR